MNLYKIRVKGYTCGFIDSHKTEKEVCNFYSMWLLRPPHQSELNIWEFIEDEGLGKRVHLEGIAEW
jgi:hypothetical protein